MKTNKISRYCCHFQFILNTGNVRSRNACCIVGYIISETVLWLYTGFLPIAVAHSGVSCRKLCSKLRTYWKKIVVCYDSMIFRTQPTCAIVLNDSHCICVGVFYPTTTWKKETILRNFAKQPNVPGKSWRNTLTYTQNYYASSILLILSSQMQWHSVSLFIYHSEGLNCINEQEKTGLCHFYFPKAWQQTNGQRRGWRL